MQQNPFQGDIRKLQGLPGFRRRVGNWRILFEVEPERRTLSWRPLNAEPRPPIR
jgi:mRNA-degrading endonuclease RelE of RelBE toxin-antitoxin system